MTVVAGRKNQVETLAGDMEEYDGESDPRETARHNDEPSGVLNQPLGEHPWLLQVSLKTPAGTLINVRGLSAWDIAAGLESIRGMVHEITGLEREFSAGAALAPLVDPARNQYAPQPSAPPQQPQQQQWGQPPQQQWPGQSGGWGGQPQAGGQPQNAPVCKHGMAAKHVPGGIAKSGRPYRAFWACAMPREQQCDFRADG